VAGRLRTTAVVLALVGSACAAPGDVDGERLDTLAATCVSIVERRHGDDFDRDALRARAGSEAFADIYDQFGTRRPSAVTVLRRQCRARPAP